MWEYPDDDESVEEEDDESDEREPQSSGEGQVDDGQPEEDDEDDGVEEVRQDEEMGEPDDEPEPGYQLRRHAQAKVAKKGKQVVRRTKTSTQIHKVHCAGKIGYWEGMIELIEGYWTCVRFSVWIVWAGKWQYAVS